MVESIKRFTTYNWRVLDLVLLLMLVWFMGCVVITIFHFFGSSHISKIEVGQLVLVLMGSAMLLIGRVSYQNQPFGASRKREATLLALIVSVALLAAELYRWTGKTWPVIVIVCISVPVSVSWRFLGDLRKQK